MPTVAWLSSETPDVRGGGGQRRQFHQISVLLSHGVDVRVATLAGEQDDSAVRALAPIVRFRPAGRRLRRRRSELAAFLARTAPAGAVVAHVESLVHFAQPLARAGVPFAVDFHNVNSRWHAGRGEEPLASAWEQRERAALRSCSLALACSDEERAALAALEPGARIEVAPHGIEPREWPEEALSAHREPAVALFGSWLHEPNRQAAVWLVERVWPLVRRDVPEAALLLAGPGEPPPACLAAPGVRAMGRVNDLARFLGGVRVVAVPIRHGIGARVKFGEALASGAAVVSTSAGAEGFDTDAVFVRVDAPDAFAAACATLLRDEEQARRLGAAGRELAFERLTWERAAEPLIHWARRV